MQTAELDQREGTLPCCPNSACSCNSFNCPVLHLCNLHRLWSWTSGRTLFGADGFFLQLIAKGSTFFPATSATIQIVELDQREDGPAIQDEMLKITVSSRDVPAAPAAR